MRSFRLVANNLMPLLLLLLLLCALTQAKKVSINIETRFHPEDYKEGDSIECLCKGSNKYTSGAVELKMQEGQVALQVDEEEGFVMCATTWKRPEANAPQMGFMMWPAYTPALKKASIHPRYVISKGGVERRGEDSVKGQRTWKWGVSK